MKIYRNGLCAQGHDVTKAGSRYNDGHCKLCRQKYQLDRYHAGERAKRIAKLTQENQAEV